jgi:hypothetical protein
MLAWDEAQSSQPELAWLLLSRENAEVSGEVGRGSRFWDEH